MATAERLELADLLDTLTPEQWAAPSLCAGWSVRDVCSHLIGMELELLGEPAPAHRLPSDLLHIRNEVGRHMEIAVDLLEGVQKVDQTS